MASNLSVMIYLTLLLCLGCTVARGFDKIYTVYEWKYLDFVWENSTQKSNAIDSGDYVVSNCFPFDTDQAPDGRIFVTVVKSDGVPATLTTVSEQKGDGGPLLRPYPSWAWNQAENCTGITGVYRVSIVQNRLYVLDTGVIGDKSVCPAQLLIFDLTTDRLLRRIIIPSKYAKNENGTGLLVTPVVDVRGSRTDETRVYMADAEGYGLVVWDGKRFARIESKSFDADPDASHYTIGNYSFDLSDGILGMALTRDSQNPYNRLLYYRPLSSYNMYNLRTSDLNLWKDYQSGVRYTQEPNKLRSQSAAQAFSRRGVLFFSSVTDTSLICWNRFKTFNDRNTVQFAINKEKLQFASGMKVISWGPEEVLLVMTNRYQRIANNNVNFTDVNFRVLGGWIRHIIRGTNCE